MYEAGAVYHYGKRRRGRRGKMLSVASVSAALCSIVLIVSFQGIMQKGLQAEQRMKAGTAESMEASAPEESAALPVYGPVYAVPAEDMAAAPIHRENPLIMIDAGHGGMDAGCQAASVLEKTINLKIAQMTKIKLEEMGFQVMMVRDDDRFVTLEDRTEMANRDSADAYISIHQNVFEQSQIKGIETWYDGSDSSRNSKRLASLVHRETISQTGAVEREVREDAEFYVTGHTTMPACLIETGFLSNAKERSMLETSEYAEKVASGIAEGIFLYFYPKTMYLTFDDGPSAENTAAILDILKERNIKATFFVVGENVRRNPEVAKRIVAEGHTIGIHCNNHEYKEIYSSAESYMEDFEKASNIVEEVTGVRPLLFRFPGGSINDFNKKVRAEIISRMSEQGYVYFDWNASLEDAVTKCEPEELIRNAIESTLGRKKVVLLAHDVVSNTVQCLEELLDQFPEYQMTALNAEVEPIQFRE